MFAALNIIYDLHGLRSRTNINTRMLCRRVWVCVCVHATVQCRCDEFNVFNTGCTSNKWKKTTHTPHTIIISYSGYKILHLISTKISYSRFLLSRSYCLASTTIRPTWTHTRSAAQRSSFTIYILLLLSGVVFFSFLFLFRWVSKSWIAIEKG